MSSKDNPIPSTTCVVARTVAASAAAILAATVCAQAQGLPYGSPKEAYIEALADMAPVTLVMMSTGSPGDNGSRPSEAYGEAVREWSGGKIVPEMVYGSAIIQGNAAPAIADGRLTYSYVIAQYDPSNMPANAALVDLTFMSNPLPFAGILHSFGTMMETGNGTPQLWAEQRRYGVEPGFIINGTSPSGFFCREPRTSLTDFNGVQTRSGGVVHAHQVESVGGANVSLPVTEAFEALQRGIVDCALTNLTSAVIVGIIPVAPNHTISPDVSFALTATNNAFDQVFWEEIPLEARQLLYDLQKVFIEETLLSNYAATQEGLELVLDSGGQILELDEDVRQLLRDGNDRLLEAARSNPYLDEGNAVVDAVIANAAKWDAIIAELGYYDIDPGWADFADWYHRDEVDVTPFVDRLYEEAMLPYRPE